MGPDYFIFYTEANIVCIVILAILLIHDRINGTKQEKQIRFNRTVIAHIGYFVSDIFWAGVLSGQFPRTRFLVCLCNYANLILLSVMAYEWFMYMAASEDMPFRLSRRNRRLWMIPMLTVAAAVAVSYAAAPTFWISESGELNSWYYPVLIAVPTLYLMLAFGFSMSNARKTDSTEKKHLYWLIGLYPMGVLAFGLVQTFMLNAPLFCFGCTIMMLFFYIESTQTLISVDVLTRMNNRGQINRYMEQVRRKENTAVWTMMIDIDGFKHINDTYGHAEGDKALILMAETLKQACAQAKAPVFIGRYGGDEFTVFLQATEGDNLPERFAESVRSILAEKQQANRLPYSLEASIGYAVLGDGKDTMHACMERADEKLYEDKRARGKLR